MSKYKVNVKSLSVGRYVIIGNVYNSGQQNNEQIGPRPVQLGQIRSCFGCKYHNQIGVRFGHDSNDYNHFCEHESVLSERSYMGLTKGRIIGKSTGQPVSTPEWCPILKAKLSGTTK